MTTFLRLLADRDKASGLLTACKALRSGRTDVRVFDVPPDSFRVVPGAPFAYWVSENVRLRFAQYPQFLQRQRWPSIGASTKDDFRYLRTTWEVPGSGMCSNREQSHRYRWAAFAKGGSFSKFYAPIHLCVNWMSDGKELKADISEYRGSRGWGYQWSAALNGHDYYFRSGLTWPRRTQRFGVRVMPRGCIFADKGPAVFVSDDSPEELLALLSLMSSRAFEFLIELSLNAGDRTARSYEVGLIQKTPVPNLPSAYRDQLVRFARRAWSLKRILDTSEVSHTFLLPAALRDRLGNFNPPTLEAELADIQAEIDEISFELYGFDEADRLAAGRGADAAELQSSSSGDVDDEEDGATSAASEKDALLSWAVGVAFGRFDWRLATGEREAPPEPDPFDPLPTKSPGMLPDNTAPFHPHAGILVDDPGHPHDLARLAEEVLMQVGATVPSDVRRWLQRDFFPFHLQGYSKSRRKAPIYWPLSTVSGSYTLWVYFPNLTNQTLYTAINDFIEPKLKLIGTHVTTLRNKGTARSRDDEKQYEALQAFELELIELRDTLLGLAPTYKPNHNDGVQISAAPLWQLFRHKPWQKVLKETWAKLEKGDYDWAHLAMNYWPERVREVSKADRSLAIAHNMENLYVEPEAKSKKVRGKKAGDAE